MQVDLTPVLDTSISLAALGLGTLGSFALARLGQRLGIQANSAAMATYDSALDKALQFGLSQVTGLIARRGWDHPDVKNATLALAVPTLVDRFPDALKAVGLDPMASSTRDTLTAALNRAFPAAVAQVAASPATPDASVTMATAPEQDPVTMVQGVTTLATPTAEEIGAAVAAHVAKLMAPAPVNDPAPTGEQVTATTTATAADPAQAAALAVQSTPSSVV